VNILLLAMPDSFEHMPHISVRMPNGALASLAGNVDPHHAVAIADLILARHRVRETVEQLVREHAPDVVGLSIMTFQRSTAMRIITLIKHLKPEARIVVGGYDPSLATEAYTSAEAPPIDFIVRGEGEITFRELLRALEADTGLDRIAGLSWREGNTLHHNPARPVSRLEGGEIRLPDRSARVLRGYTMLGRQVDVIETSRGCTYDCSFCSIVNMRGRNFHPYDFDRVIADIRDAHAHGARSLFIIDDNVMLNVERFAALCRAIIDAGLNHIDYSVQAMTSSIANHGATLAPLMRKAGFRYVFLGIENIIDEDLEFLRARSKNQHRVGGKSAGNATQKAIEYIHANHMLVVGGLIVGNPGDTVQSVQTNLRYAWHAFDWPYIQHPTPYPGTPMAADFRARGLIIHERLDEYDGTTAVVKTEHMAAEDVEFLRWQIERWIKAKHIWATFRHDPWFIITHAIQLGLYIFRGCTWRTFLGLEPEQAAFRRYRAIRRQERHYL